MTDEQLPAESRPLTIYCSLCGRKFESPDDASIVGVTLLIAIIYVLCNLLVEVRYAHLDPRIKYG